jgi:uncharacterized membrane protein (TIGR02234 family)
VLAAAKASGSSGTLGGSTTSGASPGDASGPVVIAGSAGHAVMAGAPWRAVAVIGAAGIILAGLATVARGSRWPVMSARFDRAGQQARRPAKRTDASTMWESLSQDIDPTLESEKDAKDPDRADQLDGGTRG